MKKAIMTLLLAAGALVGFAQERDHTDNDHRVHNGNRNQTPTAVQQAWQRDHASDPTPQWNQTNGQWQAHYQDARTHRDVTSYYDNRGRQIDTHSTWDQRQMPETFQQNVDRRYHQHGNYSVNRIDRPNQKEVYQVHMKNNRKTRQIYTDENGNEIRYREPHRN